METSRDISLHRDRVEGEFWQVCEKFCPGLFENFEPIFGPCSNFFNLEFTPGNGLAKIKVGEGRLKLGKRSFYVCEA